MKKIISICLIAALAATMMTACTDSSKPAQDNADKQKTTKDASAVSGNLSYVSWNNAQEDQLKATIEGFKEVNPNVKVDLQFTPWSEFWTKMEAAASGGNLPDIITMHTIYAQKYVNAKMVAQLDDLADYDETFTYDNFPEDVTRLYTFDDKHYGVPKDVGYQVLAYNKELFDNAGVEYPTAEWRWKDLENAAKAITKKENNVYGYAAYNNIQEAWGNMLYQNGGSIIDETNNVSGLDSKESIEAMKVFMGWLENYSPSTAMLAETDRRAMFASGNIGMLSVGNWQLNNFTDNEAIKDKFEIAPLPAGPDGTKATISNGLAYSVSANSKNMDAAKSFVAYLGSEDANTRAAIGVSIPAYNGAVKTWAEKHKEMYNTDVIVDELQYGVQYVSTESRTQWEAALNVHLEKLFNGEVDVETAFTNASAEINQILANE